MDPVTQGLIFKARVTVSQIEDVYDFHDARRLIDQLARRIDDLIDVIEKFESSVFAG